MRPSEPSLPSADTEPRFVRLQPWLLAAAGALGSLLLFWSMRQAELDDARADFTRVAMTRIAAARQAITSGLEQLYSTVALFDSSDAVEPDEFRTFTRRGLERHHALRAVFWIEVDGERFHRVRFAEGAEHDAFAGRGDLRTDPFLRETLDDAASERRLVVSAPLAGVPTQDATRVFAALPVLSRSLSLEGFVGGLYDPVHLFASDPEQPGGPFPLHVEDAGAGGVTLVEGGPRAELRWPDLSVGGRTWSVLAAPPQGFVDERLSPWPWAALLLGLLATGLLVAAVHATTGRARMQRLVERRTNEVMAAYDTLAQEAKERLWAVSEARQLEQRLRDIVDLLPQMVYVKDWHGRFLLANRATAEAYGTTVEALTASSGVDVNADVTAPDATLREERALMEARLSAVVPATTFVDARGSRRILRVLKIPYSPARDGGRALLCVATDVTDQKHAEDVLRGQARVLERLARGADTDEVLAELVNAAEEVTPGMRCSVLLLAPDGRHLRHRFAPSMPAFYNEAIDGLPIGPDAGSCGAAAARGERVVVEDVRTHANWAPYRDLAARAGVRACWSEPIRATDGEVLGTFAMYYAEPRAPEPYEEEQMESLAHLAGIAIEHGRAQAAR